MHKKNKYKEKIRTFLSEIWTIIEYKEKVVWKKFSKIIKCNILNILKYIEKF